MNIGNTRAAICLLILLLTGTISTLQAEPQTRQPAGEAPAEEIATAGDTDGDDPTAARKLTVAVLNFTAKDPAAPELGGQIAGTLDALLSGEPGFSLVDRRSLTRVLQEQELSLTGLVSTDQAVRVGELVGARIMLLGRAFTLGEQLFVIVKMVGTETSRVEGVMVRAEVGADLGELVVRLSEKVARRLWKTGPGLVAGSKPGGNRVKALVDRLADRRRPTLAVVVREQHHAAPQPFHPEAIDPAAETELKKLLLRAGFTIRDVPRNELAGFTRDWKGGDGETWPRGLEGVDVVIAGEAFSELTARLGNLVSCSARAEINVIRREDGRIDHADRTTTRAADLSERIAGKTALQRAGRAVGAGLLEYFDRTLPPTEKEQQHEPED